MCYATRSASRAELTDAQVRKVFRELRKCGALFLMLSGGEPTLHPSFFSLLEDAAELGFAVTVLSNATLLDRAACRRLADCGRLSRVSVSLYGAKARTPDGVTRVRGSFNRTREAAACLAALGKDVMLKFLIMRPNEREIGGIPVFAHRMGLPFQIDTTVTARDNGDPAPLQFRASEEAMAQAYTMAMAEHRRISAERGSRNSEAGTRRVKRGTWDAEIGGRKTERGPEEPSRERERAVEPERPPYLPGTSLRAPARGRAEKRWLGPLCAAGASYCIVNAYGDCCPCPQIPIPQGNVTETPLAKIWRTGKLFRELRTLRTSDLRACRVCSISKYCRRCPGLALMEAGSLDVPSETACREARAWQRAGEGAGHK